MTLGQNTGNLLDIEENELKWLKIAEFTGQNYKFSRGRIPPDPQNVNFLVQKDWVRDFTPAGVYFHTYFNVWAYSLLLFHKEQRSDNNFQVPLL